MWINFKFLKFVIHRVVKLFVMFNEVTALLEQPNVFKLVFLAKACFKVFVRSMKIEEAIVFLVDPYY